MVKVVIFFDPVNLFPVFSPTVKQITYITMLNNIQ